VLWGVWRPGLAGLVFLFSLAMRELGLLGDRSEFIILDSVPAMTIIVRVRYCMHYDTYFLLIVMVGMHTYNNIRLGAFLIYVGGGRQARCR